MSIEIKIDKKLILNENLNNALEMFSKLSDEEKFEVIELYNQLKIQSKNISSLNTKDIDKILKKEN